MRSQYKTLGPYIRELKNRNRDGTVSDLRGVSIGKEFMPSVANVNGTDLSKYKRVEQGQFAFNPMHVARDEVLPIALLTQEEPVIVSPAYVVFETLDHDQLLPEYLMIWCRRSEFDRNAWFTTDNSVRGGFSWQNFYDMELVIPAIEKQREIVKEYQTIVDRIRLHERLNEKLEEAAQAIYKQWFIDFEFPMKAEYAESIGKPELAGLPYKSSGGEMEYNEVLEQELPKGWTRATFGEYFPVKTGKKDANFASPTGIYPFYTCSQTQTLFTDTYSFDCAAILLAGNGDFNLKVYEGKFEAYQRTYVLEPYDPKLLCVLYLALCYELPSITMSQRGSVISYLTKGMIGDHLVTFPPVEELACLSMKIDGLVRQLDVVATEQRLMSSLQEILLGRLSIMDRSS